MDPSLSDEAQKLTFWKDINKWLEEQAQIADSNVYLINEHLNADFLRTNKRQKVAATWRFGEKAKYGLGKDEQGNITRYCDISWKRVRCVICGTWWSSKTSNNLAQHLSNAHKDYIQTQSEELQNAFAAAIGMSKQQFLNSDETDFIENDKRNKELNIFYAENESLEFQRHPQPLSNAGETAVKVIHDALIDMMVALGATPNRLNKHAVTQFLDVCFIYIYIYLFFIFLYLSIIKIIFDIFYTY